MSYAALKNAQRRVMVRVAWRAGWQYLSFFTIIGGFMVISSHLKLKINRYTFLIVVGLLVSIVSGCANAPLQRNSVENLRSIHVVQVVTPTLEAPSFMQAAIKSGAIGGVIPALIIQGDAKHIPPQQSITDLGALVTEMLIHKLPEQVAWWPQMTSHQGTVPVNYIYPDGEWLRIEVTRYQVAAGSGRLLLNVNVSLMGAQNQGKPLWVKKAAFGGLVNGGEKIVMENLPDDPSQLNREIKRAAEYIVKEIMSDIR